MKENLALEIKEDDNFYTCTKSGKLIEKEKPVCPTPNTYCKFRSACIIFSFYKENAKKDKKI
ncbi:MAG: hypothetical protein N2202_00210 [Proteobacteria bacterium]|nr:hypothetical protein [Pseudomonadota bacterium]